jgi:hypothetical protein
MDFTTLLAGGSIAGLAVGLVTGFWAKIKTWILFLCSLVVEDVELGTNETAQMLLGYLLSNCKRSGLYSRFYNVTGLYDKSKRNLYVQVPAEVLGLRNVLFWYNRRPVILIRETKKVGGPTSNSTQIDCYLRFIRGTIDVDKLLKEAVAYHVKTEYLQMEDLSLQKTHANNRFYIKYYRASRAKTDGKDKAAEVDNGGKRTLDGSYGAGVYAQIYGDWAKSPSLRLIHDQPSVLSAHRKPAENNLERLYYPDEVLNLIAEMKYWLTTKLWHQAKRIPWKRGWLLHGVPGTGKTALVRAFSQDLDLPVHVFELTSMSNADFIAAWADMKTHTPCVALLEDFDNVFNGRTNRSAMASPMTMGARRHKKTGDAETAADFSGSSIPSSTLVDSTDKLGVDDEEGLSSMFGGGGYFLTFDTFLNVLDGIEQADGIFTVITTNDLTKIDPALGVSANEPGVDSTMSTRPGRIDRVIHLTYMLPEHKIDLATWILSDFPELLADVTAEVLANPKVKETPAQFQEKCSRLALQEKFRRSIKEQS